MSSLMPQTKAFGPNLAQSVSCHLSLVSLTSSVLVTSWRAVLLHSRPMWKRLPTCLSRAGADPHHCYGSLVTAAAAAMAGLDQPVSLKYFDLKGHGGLCGLGGGIRFFFYTQGIQ
jgi:hypothetical protein